MWFAANAEQITGSIVCAEIILTCMWLTNTDETSHRSQKRNGRTLGFSKVQQLPTPHTIQSRLWKGV